MACESESGEGMPVWLSLCWPAAGFYKCFSALSRCTEKDLILVVPVG